MYKTLIILGFMFVAAPASLPKLNKQINKKSKKEVFESKFEKAYEVKTYEDFKKDFFKKFEKVSNKWYNNSVDIYTFVRIYSITKSFYERIIEIMRDLSGYGNESIEDLSEFVIVLSETLIFIEDILDSVDNTTENITDPVILKEFHHLLRVAADLEVKLENWVSIYSN